jgi:acyl-coenzyme A synthetase/AMP-(fatty) acid ligase
VKRSEMVDYEATRRDFSWDLPATFNFGGDVVDHWAENPDRPALIWCDHRGNERRFSFAEIRDLSNRFANLLRAQGVEKGDRVLVMLPRIPEWQIAMVGCCKLGAVPVPCITMQTARDIAYRAGHSGAVAAVTTRDNLRKFTGKSSVRVRISVGGGEGWLDFQESLDGCSERFTPVEMSSEDPAVIYYTSGSTGNPKGVTHAARGLFTWRVSAWYWLTATECDVVWCTADTGWSKAGTSILFGPWSCGAAVLFYDGPFDPAVRFELLERYRVSIFCAAATELRRLILEETSGRDLSSLRLTVSAGESVNPEVVKQWRMLTGGMLLDGYGQTETLMTVLNYPAMPVKPGSMGRPLPGTEIAVIDDERSILGPGEPGTLAIRLPNPQIMLSYWGDPELTESVRARIDGTEWFLTGDIVTKDEDGYLFYRGRADDVINSAGYRIGPLEVENTLIEHPAVQECAVVGSPDPDRGEVVAAFIVLRDGVAGDEGLACEIQNFAKRITAPYKYPRKIEFVPELPKTITGKIRRRELRDRQYGRSGAGSPGS